MEEPNMDYLPVKLDALSEADLRRILMELVRSNDGELFAWR